MKQLALLLALASGAALAQGTSSNAFGGNGSGGGTTYTAGDGLSLTGSQFACVPASNVADGCLSTGTQTISGAKTFTNAVIAPQVDAGLILANQEQFALSPGGGHTVLLVNPADCISIASTTLGANCFNGNQLVLGDNISISFGNNGGAFIYGSSSAMNIIAPSGVNFSTDPLSGTGTLTENVGVFNQIDAGLILAQSEVVQRIDAGTVNFQSAIGAQVDAGLVRTNELDVPANDFICLSGPGCSLSTGNAIQGQPGLIAVAVSNNTFEFTNNGTILDNNLLNTVQDDRINTTCTGGKVLSSVGGNAAGTCVSVGATVTCDAGQHLQSTGTCVENGFDWFGNNVALALLFNEQYGGYIGSYHNSGSYGGVWTDLGLGQTGGTMAGDAGANGSGGSVDCLENSLNRWITQQNGVGSGESNSTQIIEPQTFSFSAAIKPRTAPANGQTILVKNYHTGQQWNGTGSFFAFLLESAGSGAYKAFFQQASGSFAENAITCNGNTLVDGGWHVLSGTFDGQSLDLYEDGTLCGHNDAGSVKPVDYGSHGNWQVCGTPGGGNAFAGQIDNIILWNNQVVSSGFMGFWGTINGSGVAVNQP